VAWDLKFFFPDGEVIRLRKPQTRAVIREQAP
jgi:hypothetical protein